jgi:putative pyruvate formate lyase activating enzyme
MKTQPRRNFIKKCLYLALSGLGGGCLSVLMRCKPQEESGPQQARSQRSPKTTETDFQPAYLDLHRTGELQRRGQKLWDMMESCQLCPRRCGINRLVGQEGFCQASAQLEVASYHPHFGEEKPLVGKAGSGTIFFTNCSLRCVFCINYQISQEGQGSSRSIEDLADMMLHLQKRGCHNINLVTPTHYSPHILLAVDMAAARGLKLPLVYNTCGWERLEILKMLDGVVDIYLPDFKYSDGKMAAIYSSSSENYPQITQQALLEMHRQVGAAKTGADNLMRRGLMIRHLVMPNGVGGTRDVIRWIADNLPADTYLNIMSQYTPMYKAFDYPEISRRITKQEYRDAVGWAREAGLINLDIQGDPL